MRLVDQFYKFPGRCFFTHSSSVAKPILDTEHYVEGEGTVYMGGEMLEEACRLLGWHSPDEVDLLTADLVSARSRIAELEAELESLADIRQTLADVADRIKAEKPKDPRPTVTGNVGIGHAPPNWG